MNEDETLKHEAAMRNKKCTQSSNWKLWVNKPLGSADCRLDNILMALTEKTGEDVDWIDMAQVRVQCKPCSK
jgi:hypothetical protein